MSSEVEFDKIFNYWWEDLKWSGVFKINWVFVRDVHHLDVQEIKVHSTSIHQLKDGSRVDFGSGKRMLEMFKHSDIDSDIFEAFEFMDEREEKLRIKRDSYYEMIKQLKVKGLIPESAKQQNHYKGSKFSSYNGKKRHSNAGYKGNGKPFKPQAMKEANGKPGYYSHREVDESSEYIKKDERK
jgi:hypothetical protein